MSSQGQTVYRNYTNEYTSNKISPGSWNGSNLIITKPADAAIASGAADWGVPTGKTYSDSPSRVVLLSKGASDPTKSYPAYGNIRTSDDVVHNVFFEVTSNSSKSGLYFDIDIIVTDGTNTYSKKQNINPPPNQTHTAMIDMNGLILRGNIDINISATRTASQTYTDYSVGVTQFGSSGDSAGVNGVSNKTITKKRIWNKV